MTMTAWGSTSKFYTRRPVAGLRVPNGIAEGHRSWSGRTDLLFRGCGAEIRDFDPVFPLPYGASKLFFENALEAYGRAYGLRSVSLRYFNAAGADEDDEIGELHDPETHLIPLALAASSENGPELQVFGSNYPTPRWHLRARPH